MSDLRRTEIKSVKGLRPEGARAILELAARMEMGLPLSFRGDHEIGFNMEVLEAGIYSLACTGPLIDHTGHGCGTVACWDGHLRIELGPNYEQKILDSTTPDGRLLEKGLRALFYPPEENELSWNDITAQQAAQAGRNFVEFGEPRWEQVLDIK